MSLEEVIEAVGSSIDDMDNRLMQLDVLSDIDSTLDNIDDTLQSIDGGVHRIADALEKLTQRRENHE